jgi:GNAT superfamily N-acetyltransferase
VKARISRESKIEETPRVLQVAGMFDLSPGKVSRVEWDVELPIEERPWNIGLITGPSGCGKSTIARQVFGPGRGTWLEDLATWPSSQSVLDGFQEGMSIKEVTELLGAVGFSSPPAWLRPYHVLSTGQKFRCDLARLLSQRSIPDCPRGCGQAICNHARPLGESVLVCDEFTSVVDRTVAQIGSTAVAKAIRIRRQKFVAVSCHDDIIDWLQPDWVFLPAENAFSWRSLRRRPRITLEVSRCSSALWPLFAPHHYLSHSLCKSAWCFVAAWKGRPVAFSAWMPFIGAGPLGRREHRTVVLPDYQGVGVGSRLSSLIASMWTGLGYVARSTTTHPGFKRARAKSPEWRQTRTADLAQGNGKGVYKALKHATGRMTTGWKYVGEPLPTAQARALLAE